MDTGRWKSHAGSVDSDGVGALVDLAGRWRSERAERQLRRHLEPADLAALRDRGLFLAPVPVALGGSWVGPASARPLCETHRMLAAADPSVALVAAMHPTVLAWWSQTVAEEQPAWMEQRAAVLGTAVAGRQWGTVASEPGSGGDMLKTRAVAEPTGGEHPELPGRCYRLTGDKHFGSGFGVSDYMFTTARVVGEERPAAFIIDVRQRLAEGSSGLRVTHEWDGAGMKATQSHAVRLDGVEAVRLAWGGPIDTLAANAGGLVMAVFTAVVLGVVDEAVATARHQLGPRFAELRAYEQVEWSRAELEHWLAVQAYEGVLRAIETGEAQAAGRAGIRAKTATAELAESSLRRLTDVLGGATFSQRSPFAHWFEDVRALGFLRPPWGLAFDALFQTSQR
jgi:alkylation response protein AidB-like acyl-CoA dehydrogenase